MEESDDDPTPKSVVRYMDLETTGIRYADYFFLIGILLAFIVLLLVLCFASIAATRLIYRRRTKELVEEEQERQRRQERAWKDFDDRLKLELERNRIDEAARRSPLFPQPRAAAKVACSRSENCIHSSIMSSRYSKSLGTSKKQRPRRKPAKYLNEPTSSPSISPSLSRQPHSKNRQPLSVPPQPPYDPNLCQTIYIPQPYPTYMPPTYATAPTNPTPQYYYPQQFQYPPPMQYYQPAPPIIPQSKSDKS